MKADVPCYREARLIPTYWCCYWCHPSVFILHIECDQLWTLKRSSRQSYFDLCMFYFNIFFNLDFCFSGLLGKHDLLNSPAAYIRQEILHFLFLSEDLKAFLKELRERLTWKLMPSYCFEWLTSQPLFHTVGSFPVFIKTSIVKLNIWPLQFSEL